MPSNKLAAKFSRELKFITYIGTLIFIAVFFSACLTSPTEQDVQTAIAQTEEAKSAAQTAIDNAVATQVSAILGNVPTATPTPPASGESPPSGMTDEQCKQQCDTRVAEAVATLQHSFDLTAEAELDEDDGGDDVAGGPDEEAACDRGDFDACAKNTSGENVIVRTGPGMQWPPDPGVTVLRPGDRVPVLCVVQTGWLQIRWSVTLERDGWVAEEFMTIEGKPKICLDIPPTPKVFPTVTPPSTATPATPSPTPQAEIVFTADPTTIEAGETSVLTWSVQNVKEVYLYPVGEDWEDFPVEGEGTQEVRPFVTTKYELRVTKNDSSAVTQSVMVEVDDGLDQGTWRLQRYENITGTLETVIPNSGVTARFDPDEEPEGIVSGFGGCNNYNADYEAYDRTLKIGPISATNSSCASDIMQQEMGFFRAMENADRMFIKFDELTIRDRNGRVILNFDR